MFTRDAVGGAVHVNKVFASRASLETHADFAVENEMRTGERCRYNKIARLTREE